MAGAIVAILCLKFTKEAEKIVRKIFAFKNDEGAGSIATGLTMAAAGLGMAQKIGKGTKTFGNQLGNIGNRIRNDGNQLLATGMAIKAGREQKASGGEKESLTDRRAAALEELNNRAEARKLEKDTKKKYKNANGYKQASETEIRDRAKDIIAQGKQNNQNITMSQAMAKARLSLARENRQHIKDANGGKMPKITGVRGVIENVKAKSNQISSVISRLEIPKMAAAAGLGFFTASAAYGTGSNAATAITGGLAVQKGAEEFFKNSTRSLTNDINDRMQSIGITDVDGQNLKFDEVLAKGNNEEYSEKVFKNILKQIENALKAQGMSAEDSKNIRYSMQNSINRDLTKNPGKSVNSIVTESINKVMQTDAFKALGPGAQMSASMDLSRIATNYAVTKQEASIFQTISTAGELGIDPNRLADLSNKRFAVGAAATLNNVINPIVFDETQVTSTNVRNMDNRDLETIKTMLERHRIEEQTMMDTITEELEEMRRTGRATQEQIDDKNREIREINEQIEEINRRIQVVETEMNVRVNGNTGGTQTNTANVPTNPPSNTPPNGTANPQPSRPNTRNTNGRVNMPTNSHSSGSTNSQASGDAGNSTNGQQANTANPQPGRPTNRRRRNNGNTNS